MTEHYVAKIAEFQDGDRKIVKTEKDEVGIFNVRGSYYAYSNYCVHSGGPACEGILVNKVHQILSPERDYEGETFGDEEHFVCPWHGYEYDLKTGECVGNRRLRLRKYEIVQRGNDLFLKV